MLFFFLSSSTNRFSTESSIASFTCIAAISTEALLRISLMSSTAKPVWMWTSRQVGQKYTKLWPSHLMHYQRSWPLLGNYFKLQTLTQLFLLPSSRRDKDRVQGQNSLPLGMWKVKFRQQKDGSLSFVPPKMIRKQTYTFEVVFLKWHSKHTQHYIVTQKTRLFCC